METEVMKLIAELDAAVFVIDCLPNLNAEKIRSRTKPCLSLLRKSHPKTPILLVEDRSFSNSYLVSAKRRHNLANRAALRQIYEELRAGGDDQLFYLEGEHLLGDDYEATVDSSHPTDLGFWRQANAFDKSLRPILTRLQNREVLNTE